MDTGNTQDGTQPLELDAVQPRGYGEHITGLIVFNFNSGSAPWIRGTLSQTLTTTKQARFSPVDTGNTTSKYSGRIFNAVQPRGYGEHCSSSLINRLRCGSAPWIRGTLYDPAALTTQPTVQPRGYGEHPDTSRVIPDSCGSAPWIRGTPIYCAGHQTPIGFSPVDTGNTNEYICGRAT